VVAVARWRSPRPRPNAAALCRLIAARAGVASSRVSVVRGAKARDKVVRVEGVDAAALRARLLAG
jgi:uncharacterized protein YggU (UPF0235/DUF167 family)